MQIMHAWIENAIVLLNLWCVWINNPDQFPQGGEVLIYATTLDLILLYCVSYIVRQIQLLSKACRRNNESRGVIIRLYE